jgi:hypothetical protein
MKTPRRSIVAFAGWPSRDLEATIAAKIGDGGTWAASMGSPVHRRPSDVAYCEGFRMTADRDDGACTGPSSESLQ